MKRLKLLVAAALLGLPLAACEEGTAPPPVGEIDGTVAIEGEGVDGVTVNLSSGAATTTSGGGHFSFTDVEGGTYTITISGFPVDASFDQTSAEVTIASAGQKVTRNFSGSYIRTSSLMGQVSVEGKGLAGVTVSISGRSEAKMATDENGQYEFTGLRAGNYTVEISGFDPTDVAFASTSNAVAVAVGQTGVWNVDATYVRESAVAGQVSVEGNGLAGVTVSLQGMGEDDSENTDAGGQFTFSDLRAGEYQLAISGFDASEYGFSTTSATVRVEHGKTANVPFEGILLRTASIMGQVSIEGEGLGDVTVSLSGEGENQTTTTDDSGQYSFAELPAGNFQVGISGYDTDDYAFETTSQSVALALGETKTVPFEGILLRTSGISGRVSVEGMGLDSVTVTLTDADDAEMSTLTDSEGVYAFAGLAEGDHTVAISGYDEVAYVFEATSQEVTLGDDETQTVNFMGTHARTASVSGMLYVDEAGKNDSYDEGEDALKARGVALALVGPGINDRMLGGTDENGAFAFMGLRAGPYQLVVANDEAAGMDHRYGGPTEGYEIILGVGDKATQDIPFDITHQTVNFTVTLKHGDDTGAALPGATVTLYSDAKGEQRIKDGTRETGDDGMAAIRFARSEATGTTVHAAVAAPEGDYDAAADMQMVTWDAKSPMHAASNDGDIVNLKADFSFSGATVTTGAGGGAPLKGWAMQVSSDKSAAANTPKNLSDAGTGKYSEVVAADSLPVKYTIELTADQKNTLDGGESYEADPVEYTHTGLKLPATMPAGSLEAKYTTQTLKVYVHEERDQVRGYTGSILGGDRRDATMVDVEIRYIERSSGRSRAYTSAAKIPAPTVSKGVYTFRKLPANDQIIAIASPKTANADDIKILRPDELAAYGDAERNHIEMGMFGDEGGYNHTVELCPLRMTDPTGQDHGDCASFAYVMTHLVEGTVTKQTIAKDSGDRFKAAATVGVVGTTVSLDPVDGRNLAEETRSFKAARTNASGTTWDDRKAFNWGQVPAGVYTLGYDTLKWEAKTAADVAQPSQFHLDADLNLSFTPTTSVVYGVVTDLDGFAIDSATVTVNGNSTMTDSEGRYIVADYSQKMGSKGAWTNKPITAITASQGDYQAAHDTVAFVANTPTMRDLVLDVPKETMTISGTVAMSGTNAPVSGAVITVDGMAPKNAKGSGANRALKTAADGSYTAQIEKPTDKDKTVVNVKASKRGITITPLEGHDVPISASAVSGFHFSAFENATLTGRVKDENGKAMSGVLVKATTKPATGTAAAGTAVVSDSMITKAGGTYSLSVPPAFAVTAHTVTATKAGYTFASFTVTGLASGASKALDDFDATVPKSDDATLTALSLSGGIDLNPAFAAATVEYTATAQYNVESTTVSYTTTNAKAKAAVTSEQDTNVDSTTVDLYYGANTIKVTVTAEDGTTTNAYTITVTRRAGASAPRNLEAVSNGSDSLTVRWDPPSAKGELAFDRFEYRLQSDTVWSDVGDASSDTVTIESENGKQDTVWVRAIKIQGVHDLASNRDATTDPDDILGDSASIAATPWPTISGALDPEEITEADTPNTNAIENRTTLTITGASASSKAFQVKVALRQIIDGDTVAAKSAVFAGGQTTAMVSFSPGETQHSVHITAVDNLKIEPHPNVLVLSTVETPEAKERPAATNTLRVTDDDSLPVMANITIVQTPGTAGALDVSWTAADINWGTGTGSTPTKRKIQYRYKVKTADHTGWSFWKDVAATETKVTISGLTAVLHTVEVRAVTDVGESAAKTADGTPSS